MEEPNEELEERLGPAELDPGVIAALEEMERRPGEEPWRWALRMLERVAPEYWAPPGDPRREPEEF